MTTSHPSAHASRRTLLASAGALGASAAIVAAPAAAQPSRPWGLPLLPVGANWSGVLAETPQVQLEPGARYVLPGTVELPDNCLVLGNGATVSVSNDSSTAFSIDRTQNVTLSDLRLVGRPESPVDLPISVAHVGVRVRRGTNVRIRNCDFNNWRGAGVAVTGDRQDDYFAYRVMLEGNTFHDCYFGLAAADRSEYSIASHNSFTCCRLAIWGSSGNWSITANDVVGCYGAYYSIAATSPFGLLPADNWGHGSVVGNTFNHSNGGTPRRWTQNTAFTVGGTTRDPGPGVTLQGLLPPTFTGNTLWYTDMRAIDLVGTPWLMTGCTLSNLTITASGDVPVHLLGVQANGPQNRPRLVGNVRDLLA